jgi:topoisomerase-4 subunit A
LKEGDYVRYRLDVNTIHNLLIFTQKGQYYLLPVHQIPEFKWKENGTAIVNIIPIPKEDRIVAVIPIKDFNDDEKSLVFVTRKGQVKRTELKEYYTNRSIGIVGCKVVDQDEIIQVKLTDGRKDIILVTALGMSIRFKEVEVNAMGRVATGVRGIQLKEQDVVIAAEWVEGEEGELMVVSDLGYVKSSLVLDYPIQGRGGKGIITFEFKEGKRVRPNGTCLIRAFAVKEASTIIAIVSGGEKLIFSTEDAPIEDRKSTGKLLIPFAKGNKILDLLKVQQI